MATQYVVRVTEKDQAGVADDSVCWFAGWKNGKNDFQHVNEPELAQVFPFATLANQVANGIRFLANQENQSVEVEVEALKPDMVSEDSPRPEDEPGYWKNWRHQSVGHEVTYWWQFEKPGSPAISDLADRINEELAKQVEQVHQQAQKTIAEVSEGVNEDAFRDLAATRLAPALLPLFLQRSGLAGDSKVNLNTSGIANVAWQLADALAQLRALTDHGRAFNQPKEEPKEETKTASGIIQP